MAQQFSGIILTFIVKAYRLYPRPLLMSHSIKTRFETLHSCTTQMTRKYCLNEIPNNDEGNNKEVDTEYTNLCKNEDQSLINAISTILSVDTNKALKICNDFYDCQLLSKDEIINTITIVKEAGVSVPTIEDNILTLARNVNNLSKKLDCIAHLNDNMDEMFPLLNIDMKNLNLLLMVELRTEYYGENKIRYLANKLQCSVYKLCKLIVKEPGIISLSFLRIRTVVNLLEEYNYDSKDVLNNLWLFKYSPRTIRRRSSIVTLAGVNTVKTWVIRVSMAGLQRYINLIKKEAELTNIYGSHVRLISKKLNLTEEEVKAYIKTYPNILDVQLDKVNDVIDILLKYGYKSNDILFCRRIFLVKASVLEERLKTLQSIRGPHRLTLIYCSKKVFEQSVESAKSLYNKEST